LALTTLPVFDAFVNGESAALETTGFWRLHILRFSGRIS
jgi:hypothetical protein